MLKKLELENQKYRKALLRISRSHDCGCWPCVGQCVSQESLAITVDAMRDLASETLKEDFTEYNLNLEALLRLEDSLRNGEFYEDYDESLELLGALSKHLTELQTLRWTRK